MPRKLSLDLMSGNPDLAVTRTPTRLVLRPSSPLRRTEICLAARLACYLQGHFLRRVAACLAYCQLGAKHLQIQKFLQVFFLPKLFQLDR
jgi:hypothetical protein